MIWISTETFPDAEDGFLGPLSRFYLRQNLQINTGNLNKQRDENASRGVFNMFETKETRDSIKKESQGKSVWSSVP